MPKKNSDWVIQVNAERKDANVERKNQVSSEVQIVDGVPLFSIVEISESGTCNRSCSFCPRSDPDYPDVKKFIADELVDKLSTELSALNYSGMILFSGFVEPLLDKKIGRHVRVLKESAPLAQIELVSNGDPLTVQNLNALAQAGLDRLLLSLYDGPHQIEKLSRLIEKTDFSMNKVIFRERWLPPEDNQSLSLSNRGGSMTGALFSIPDLDSALENPCFYPANTIFIDYQGDVLLCAHDWGKRAVMGNCQKSTLKEIWTSPRYNRVRKQLLNGKRSISPCNVCNVEGTRTGRQHAEAWINLQI